MQKAPELTIQGDVPIKDMASHRDAIKLHKFKAVIKEVYGKRVETTIRN